MGGFLPKPVSKVSWTEVLTQMWGGETHPISDPSRGISKTSDIPTGDRGKRKERRRGVKTKNPIT